MPAEVTDGLTRRELYARQTRRDVLDAAIACFSAEGYGATSLTDIGRYANVTRGAVYHHFDNKLVLFEEVITEQLQHAVSTISEATTGDDPAARALSALVAFLDLCTTEPFRTVVIEQGPIALGWQRWRELDMSYTLQLIADHLAALQKTGVITVPITAVVTRLFYASLHEAADLVAHAPADDREHIQEEAVDIVLRFLAGLGAPGDLQSYAAAIGQRPGGR